MGRAPQRTSCSPGWRLHNLPRAEEQLCPQLHNSVLFNGALEAEAEPAPRPKIQAPLGGSCKAPCSVMCPTAVSRRLLRAGMQLKPWQVLPCLKQGCTVWIILGTAQALLRAEARRRGSHRSHTGDRY